MSDVNCRGLYEGHCGGCGDANAWAKSFHDAATDRDRLRGELAEALDFMRSLAGASNLGIVLDRVDAFLAPRSAPLPPQPGPDCVDECERGKCSTCWPRREPGCQCQTEIGDSPCRVHGDEGGTTETSAPTYEETMEFLARPTVVASPLQPGEGSATEWLEFVPPGPAVRLTLAEFDQLLINSGVPVDEAEAITCAIRDTGSIPRPSTPGTPTPCDLPRGHLLDLGRCKNCLGQGWVYGPTVPCAACGGTGRSPETSSLTPQDESCDSVLPGPQLGPSTKPCNCRTPEPIPGTQQTKETSEP